MSGIFARKLYDDCYQSNRINQGTAPGSYKVNQSQISNSNCQTVNGIYPYKGVWYSPNEFKNIQALSDIESHLRNLDIPDSRCLEGRSMNEKNAYAKSLSQSMTGQVTATCPRPLESTNSRLDTAVSDVKMMTQTRYDFPIIDPRAYVYMGINDEQSGSNRFGVNSRLQAKDMMPSEYYNKLNNFKINGM
jgi:hypothetical protein